MDPAETLVQGARDLTAAKYLLTSSIALTLYDYLLMFDDEIRYVWRGRKTWIFYLYTLNRILFTGYQFWEIYYASSPSHSKTECLAAYYVQVVLIVFFLFSSDIFITLRVYAITFRNKAFVVYFGTLALTRFVVSLAASFLKPPTIVSLPPVPVDAFNLCATVADIQFGSAPNSIGTAFELSAFIVIVLYTYRNKSTLKLSALIRTLVAEATVYFLVMVALQIYVQLSLALLKGVGRDLPPIVYGLLNPILTMRFALSLKRSADPEGGQEWRLKHFTSADFIPPTDTQMSTISEDIEMGPVRVHSPR